MSDFILVSLYFSFFNSYLHCHARSVILILISHPFCLLVELRYTCKAVKLAPYQKTLLFGPLLGPKIIGLILLDLLLFVFRPDPILFGFILGPLMGLTIGRKNKCRNFFSLEITQQFFLEKISRIVSRNFFFAKKYREFFEKTFRNFFLEITLEFFFVSMCVCIYCVHFILWLPFTIIFSGIWIQRSRLHLNCSIKIRKSRFYDEH
jgi:MFS family permease